MDSKEKEEFCYPTPKQSFQNVGTSSTQEETKMGPHSKPYEGILSEYKLGSVLGKGGTAKVRQATRGTEIYAIKYMVDCDDPPKGNEQKPFTTKVKHYLFDKECKALEYLDHPNVLKLHDHNDKGVIKKPQNKEKRVMYLVYELAPRGSLTGYISSRGRLSLKTSRYYFKHLVSAVEYIHNQEICHLDIKPDNILLDSNFNLKLSDFGLAARIYGKKMLFGYCGTKPYMAPELLSKTESTGEKVDIYAMGITLYVMLIAKFPFEDASSERYKVFCNKKREFWGNLRKDYPGIIYRELADLLSGMLAFDPSTRVCMKQIKEHKWLKGETSTPEEVMQELSKGEKSIKEVKAMAEITKKVLKLRETKVSSTNAKKEGKQYEGVSFASMKAKENIKQYQVKVLEQTVMYTIFDPVKVFMEVRDYFRTRGYTIDAKRPERLKMDLRREINDQPLELHVRMEAVDAEIYCIRVWKVAGDGFEFFRVFQDLKGEMQKNETIFS